MSKKVDTVDPVLPVPVRTPRDRNGLGSDARRSSAVDSPPQQWKISEDMTVLNPQFLLASLKVKSITGLKPSMVTATRETGSRSVECLMLETLLRAPLPFSQLSMHWLCEHDKLQ